MRSVFFALFTLLPAIAQADAVSELVERLKGTDEKYEIVGTICEQAARLELEREFQPPRFAIETGISYGNASRTIGELDVIIFDSDSKAALVAEVKCWKNLDRALTKAKSQRSRFKSTLAAGSRIKFWDKKNDPHHFNQFTSIKYFDSISQKGGKKAGFDRELSLSLDELMEARRRLLNCNAGGSCE